MATHKRLINEKLLEAVKNNEIITKESNESKYRNDNKLHEQ